MDIWEKLYTQAKKEYHPEDVTPFVYAHHVVCALESADGTIYTGFCIEACSGVMNLCAERVAALNMYVNSGQTKIRRKRSIVNILKSVSNFGKIDSTSNTGTKSSVLKV